MTNRASEGCAPEDIGQALYDDGVIDDPSPTIEPAGDGNINWVRRLRSKRTGQTVIVKHARPALEKFPEYETSTERIVFENRYFELARPLDDDEICPHILHFDEARRILVLEDLGEAERLDAALLRGADVDEPLLRLARFLGKVHAATRGDTALAARFQNADIQKLHGDHIFKLPYEEDGFPVPEGVEARARAVRSHPKLAATAATAYQRYLEPRGALVHADVQPGNVLLRDEGPVLLDAEIAHVGDPAFDVGTLLAHLWLARLAGTPSGEAAPQAARIWDAYGSSAGTESVSFPDVARYAGLEMMRRTIGAARVAAVATAAASLDAIDTAEKLVLSPPATPKELPVQ